MTTSYIKRPTDINQRAKMIVDIATTETCYQCRPYSDYPCENCEAKKI